MIASRRRLVQGAGPMGPRHTYRPWQVASGLDRNVDRGRPLAQPDIVSRPNRLATNEAGITRAVRLPADTHTAPANEIVGEAFDVGVGHHTPILDLRLNECQTARRIRRVPRHQHATGSPALRKSAWRPGTRSLSTKFCSAICATGSPGSTTRSATLALRTLVATLKAVRASSSRVLGTMSLPNRSSALDKSINRSASGRPFAGRASRR